MLEDIMRDFRNRTKELEILETNLFELVPLFRVTYAQPAFVIQPNYKFLLLLRIIMNYLMVLRTM